MTEKVGRIIFITNSIYPVADSGGGSIVMYRHLKRFQNEGYEVVFVNTIQHEQQYRTEFREIKIHKKKWYPPLRQATPWLTTLRSLFYFNKLKQEISIESQDIVLSMFGDYTNLLSLKIATYYRIPLFMVYHDDSIFNEYGKLNLMHRSHISKLINKTNHFFAVCEPMKKLLEKNGIGSCSVLYPIPQGYSGPTKSWDGVEKTNLNYYNSGLLFEDLHLEILHIFASAAAHNHSTVNLIGRLPSAFEKKLLGKSSLQIHDRFDKTEDLFKHLLKKADVLLVFYSFKLDKEHRMFHSFPSKFAEYCHLGIPILIVAPPESAIGQWAIEHHWKSYVNSDNENDLNEMMKRFKNEGFWNSCKDQSLAAAKSFFDPEKIHAQLSSRIFEQN